MKQLFIIIILFFGIVFSVNAQDLIILRDGNMIEAKVIEISLSEIRYKRFDNLDGPTIVVPTDNVLSIKYENGTMEIINNEPKDKEKPPVIDPNKFYFSLSADPSGFLMYGPFILTEFSKNHFNAQFYISFPSVGLVVKSDGFGIGFGLSINYLWHIRIGAFYLGGLFDYIGYKIHIPGLTYLPDNGKYSDGEYDYKSDNLWQNKFTVAMNLGFKFILSSGIYFTTGGSIGAAMSDDIRNHGFRANFYARPNISMGYMF